MAVCLLIQPIHPAGIARLEAAGFTVRHASAHDMDTVACEIGDATCAVTRNAGLNRTAMDASPQLKVLGNHGIGTNPVDLARATEIGLPVVNTPFANVQSVAELALGDMLAVARKLAVADAAVRAGRFDLRYTGGMRELHGKTLGIVGFGTIGRRTVELAKAAFAMRPVIYSPRAPDEAIESVGGRRAPSLSALLADADVVSLHTPLRPDTRAMFNADTLAHAKPGLILVNTARGALIDNDALAAALADGRIAGAAVDVFDPEPPPADHPLLHAPNVLLTPHIGGATEEAMERTALQTVEQMLKVLAGIYPDHLVNPEVWDRRRT